MKRLDYPDCDFDIELTEQVEGDFVRFADVQALAREVLPYVEFAVNAHPTIYRAHVELVARLKSIAEAP